MNGRQRKKRRERIAEAIVEVRSLAKKRGWGPMPVTNHPLSIAAYCDNLPRGKPSYEGGSPQRHAPVQRLSSLVTRWPISLKRVWDLVAIIDVMTS